MDTDKKKELRAAYKERPREAGVVFVTCGATGEMFLADVVDAPAAFNRMRFQLSSGLYPDKRLQASGTSTAKAPSSSACCSASTPAMRMRTSPRNLKRSSTSAWPNIRKPPNWKAVHGARAPVDCFGFWDGLRKHKLTAF